MAAILFRGDELSPGGQYSTGAAILVPNQVNYSLFEDWVIVDFIYRCANFKLRKQSPRLDCMARL